jgi:outer membrane receptor for ferrienterochelin and colicin
MAGDEEREAAFRRAERGDKDLSRDDYSYTEEGRRYFMAVDYRF